jgi:hypothetical protein
LNVLDSSLKVFVYDWKSPAEWQGVRWLVWFI